MKIAVLSDVHGNYVALQKCIEYALRQDVKKFIFLGDYIGELAYPQRTMDILYVLRNQFQCYFIRGNKEDYWINYRKNGRFGWRDNDSTTGALLYAYKNLEDEDIDFFASMPMCKELAFENLPPITICHGSPNKTNEQLRPGKENTYATMENEKNSLIICGHTHLQETIDYKDKLVLNPGAVGVPLYSDGKAQFMILHGEDGSWRHEFVSLIYDVEKVVADLYESGLNRKAPYWTKVTEHVLRNGTNPHGSVLAKAMLLCRQDKGECKWPDIPEKYWQQAVAEMIA